MWMLSTKMMPPVGALIPIYLLFRDGGLLDTAAARAAAILGIFGADHDSGSDSARSIRISGGREAP